MVKEVVTYCDVCAEPDDAAPVKGQTHLVAVAGGAWSLDLCPSHYEMLVAPLADVAERLGEVVKGQATRPPSNAMKGQAKARGQAVPAKQRANSEPCLLCGHVSPKVSALIGHLKHSHHTNLEGVYGLACPLCARDFESATALAVHVSRSHREAEDAEGAASIPGAFRYAAEHGDPHAIVGKVLAQHGLMALPPRPGAGR